MMRRPLIPWISARTRSAQSQVRQNGLCQRAATKQKLTRSPPPPPVVEHVHDQDVPNREHEQHQPADPHIQPRPELEATDGSLAPACTPGSVARGRRRAFGSLDGHQKTPADSRIALPMMIVIGIMLRTKMIVEASAIPFMWRALDGQKKQNKRLSHTLA